MFNVTQLYGIGAVAGLTLPLFLTRWKAKTSECAAVTREDAVESVKLMKDWGVWLTGIQTAAIAAIGAFFRGAPLPPPAKLAVLFFTVSILMDTILLAGLPSIVLRLKRTVSLPPDTLGIAQGSNTQSTEAGSTENDIYELRLFASSVYGRRAGAVYVVSHIYFVLGIIAFAVAFALFPSPVSK